jgi:hypothetical protein
VGPLDPEYLQLSGQVFDPLQKCVAVGEWPSACYRRLVCVLDEAVFKAVCGVQIVLGLAGENGLYVVGSRLDLMLRKKSSGTSEKMRHLAVAHLLERKELADAFLPLGGAPPHELGPQRGVGVSFRWRGDDILYFRCVPLGQLKIT